MVRRTLHVAFVTKNRERIYGGLEDAERIALYVVDAEDAADAGTISFDPACQQKKKCTDEMKILPGYTRCGGRKLAESMPEEREIQARVLALQEASVKVLVVQSALHAITAIELKRAGIFPVRVEKQEFIGAVLMRLQEMLRLDTPLWMERRINASVDDSLKGFSF